MCKYFCDCVGALFVYNRCSAVIIHCSPLYLERSWTPLSSPGTDTNINVSLHHVESHETSDSHNCDYKLLPILNVDCNKAPLYGQLGSAQVPVHQVERCEH